MQNKMRQYKVIPRASIESLLAKPAPYGRDLKVTRVDENPRPIKPWFTSVLIPLQMLIGILVWLILLPINMPRKNNLNSFAKLTIVGAWIMFHSIVHFAKLSKPAKSS